MTPTTSPLQDPFGPPYVYVLIRTDIPLAQQLVQSNHAALQAGFDFKKPEAISRLIVLSVPSKTALLAAATQLEMCGIGHHLFFEPDFEIGYSALATQPLYHRKDRDCLKKYPLYGGHCCSSREREEQQ
jgi:hypothetical protein